MKIISANILIFFIALLIALLTIHPGLVYGRASDTLTNFRDIPGITQEEIYEIEALLSTRTHFTYAMMLNEEAFYTQEGQVSGFAARVSDFLSGLFGVPFIPMIVEWYDLIGGLDDGTLDFTGQLARTPERLEIYAMTDSIVMRPIAYVKIGGSTPLLELDHVPRLVFYEGGVTEGALEGSGVFPEFETIFVSNAVDAAPIILRGDADAFFGDGALSLTLIHPELSFYVLTPPIFRHGSFSAQDPELFPIVNAIQRLLYDGGMQIFGELYALGMEDFLKHQFYLSLTPADMAFLETDPVIRVGATCFDYPVSFYNHYDGEFQGIAFDVMAEIELLTGLRFELVNTCTCPYLPELLTMVEHGEIDMVVGIIRASDLEGRFLRSNHSLSTDNFVLISSTDFFNINLNEVLYSTVGLVEHGVYRNSFFSFFPDHTNVAVFPGMDTLLDALLEGRIDMAFACRGRLLYLNNFRGNPNFWANIEFDDGYDIYFGFNQNDPQLVSVMDKALALTDIASITNQWNGRTFDYSYRIMQAQLPWLFGAGLLFVCVIILLTMLFVIRSNERDRLRTVVEERTRALELESALLNTVFDSIPDVIFCKDLDLRYLRINRAFEDLFMLDRGVILGMKDKEVLDLPFETEKSWRQRDKKILAEKLTLRFEEPVPASDGIRTFETVKTPLVDQDGNLLGLIGLARDITQRKEMEVALENVSRAKTAFISNMSHEIRTPMNSIIGFSELALTDASPKTKVYLTRIIENAKWLLQIIDDILDVSKIESGKMELENVPFDLKEVFDQCRTMIFPKATEKNIKLFFYAEPPEEGKLLLGDSIRLRQVFINLLSNAVKFTNVGMIRVTAFVSEHFDNRSTIYFEVRDSGIGMTQQQIDKIYEPFVQADISITRKYGGSGLGLAITKNLIDMMGGELTVSSVKGLGSKFSFVLTFDTVDTDKVEEHNQKSPLVEIEQPFFDAEVLVCEDNEMNQMVIKEHLTRLGLKVAIAENGQIGLNVVKERAESGQSPFDLILMDIHMPVMDGLDAAERIIALETGVPLVAMTANIMSTDKEIYHQSGMLDCVGKPFTSQELWACLLKYLNPVEKHTLEKHTVEEHSLETHIVEKHSLEKHTLEEHSLEEYPVDQRGENGG